MNLYRLSDSPIISAIWLPDSHLGEMGIFVGISLSACHRLFDGSPRELLIANNISMYPWALPDETLASVLPLFAMRDDPISQWVRKSRENYFWMFYYFLAILREYETRHLATHSYIKYLNRLIEPPEQLEMLVNEDIWPDLRQRKELIGEKPKWRKRKEPWWYEKR